MRGSDGSISPRPRIRPLPRIDRLTPRRLEWGYPPLSGGGLEHHVQLENFFEQFGWNVLRTLLPDIEAFQLQKIFSPPNRVLQNQEVQRVGSLTPRKVDLRVIAVTNRDLRAAIAEKRFREEPA